MKISRPSRVLGAVLALVSMLFMQLVLAGYMCPKISVDAPASEMPAISSMAADMPNCEQMDTAQPTLCHASVHTVYQSLDKHELPSVQPFVPATIALVLVHIAVPITTNPFNFNTALQSGAPPPPVAIRNCCFRI